ncbi:MAG: dihydrodipicolinate synthase family protein, partial [Kiloniellales bacterium]
MKTSKVISEDLSASVVAVPPLARNRDFSLNRDQNLKLIRHLEAGGITTLMYGGNANFYNIALSEYAEVLAFLAEAAAPASWVIPSVGPDYGKMMDQAVALKDIDFPTAMVLPIAFPATPSGIETGIRRFTDRLGKPVVFYIKSDGYVAPEGLGRMVDDGLICAVKYAVVREDPGRDDYLSRLFDRVDARYVLSGIGERPAVAHMRVFGLPGFTSGSVCVA